MSPAPKREEREDALAPYARALRDFHVGGMAEAEIGVHSSLGERDIFPVSLFFRGEDDFLPWEHHALDLCRGRVLDAGAGAGVHSLALQARGLEVTAVDLLPDAVEIMRDRGVADARQGDFLEMEEASFDTVLLMMNGFGPAGSLPGLDRLLRRLPRLLAPGGQLVGDSARPLVFPSSEAEEAWEWPPAETDYPGEAWIRLEYRGELGEPFRELYVDLETLTRHAGAAGWTAQPAYQDATGSYLVRLVRP